MSAADPAALPADDSVIVRRDATPTRALERHLDSPLLAAIYAGRGVQASEALDYRLARLPHYRHLPDVETAAVLVGTAIENGHRLHVVGDFDADGATATALVCQALAALGAERVDYSIPHRVRHGYGLSAALAGELGTADVGDVLITVDNGTASFEGIDAARAAGWQVVVCDHHLAGERLPSADALVNPNRDGDDNELAALAGVGVAFYLLAALRARCVERVGAPAAPRLSDWLDLVAIGTVADLVPMSYVNRVLVSQGLRRIRCGGARPGVAALIEAAGRTTARLTPLDIGMAVAPRLNAAGRLDDMARGVACLTADDHAQARSAAGELGVINDRRRQMQRRMQAEADAAIAETPDEDSVNRAAWVVYRPDWHEGVVGLIAARLCERHHRPAVAFAPSAEGQLKGSMRSIDGVHARDVLAAVATAQPGVIERLGGHAGAAGLTLAAGALTAFEAAFNAAVKARLSHDVATRRWLTDGALRADQLTLATAQRLQDAGPWGVGFAAPCFDGEFEIVDQRIVGERHLKLRLSPLDERGVFSAIWFNRDALLEASCNWRLVYRLEVNVFNEQRLAQLVVLHAQMQTS